MTCVKLSDIGNPLERINFIVDFVIFRETLEAGDQNNEKKAMQEPSLLPLL